MASVIFIISVILIIECLYTHTWKLEKVLGLVIFEIIFLSYTYSEKYSLLLRFLPSYLLQQSFFLIIEDS